MDEEDTAAARRNAAEALGRPGDEKGVEALLAALKDVDDDVRANAAEALGRLGDQKAVEPLLDALKDEHDKVRASAARALGHVNDERAVRALLESSSAVLVRWVAAIQMGQLGEDILTRTLVKALSQNDTVRRRAAEVVGDDAGDPKVLDELTRAAATDPADDVRKAAGDARDKYERKRRLAHLLNV